MFTYTHVTDGKALDAIIGDINTRGKPVALDLETTGLDRFKDKILCGVLSTWTDRENGTGAAVMIEPELLPSLHKLSVPLRLHNFRFDYIMLHQLGIDLRGTEMLDTMLLHHLYNENLAHGLDDIIQEKYKDPYKELFWAKYKSYQEASYQDKLEYACKDAIYTDFLAEDLLTELAIERVPDSLIEHVHELALALYDTEVMGLKIDLNYIFEVGGKLKQRIDGYKHELRAVTPEVELVECTLWEQEIAKFKTDKKKLTVPKPEFNWDSGKQLQVLLHDVLGIRRIKRKSKATKKVATTLDDAALNELSAAHPLIPILQNYRADAKVYGTYIEGILERQHAGRIYSSFNVNGTVTGRISSSNPNMQNLPREGDIRGIYIPDTGHTLVSADYGQLEVVIAAHFSQEPNLLKIIFEGASKHDITAAALGIPRHTAKTLNFGMQYLAGIHKVKEILNCSKSDAEFAYNRYWATYAKERQVIDSCIDKVNKGIPIVNLFGRKRRFPTQFDAEWKREAAYRQAYSSLIQGSGADITNRAYYEMWRYMKETDIGRTLFQVHDEIVVQPKVTHTEEAREKLQSIMKFVPSVVGVELPFTVECSQGLERWSK